MCKTAALFAAPRTPLGGLWPLPVPFHGPVEFGSHVEAGAAGWMTAEQREKGHVQTLQSTPQAPACKAHKQRLQSIPLPRCHIIRDAGSCEAMCLSINSHHWLEEVKLFSQFSQHIACWGS